MDCFCWDVPAYTALAEKLGECAICRQLYFQFEEKVNQ
jgi:hypothetical protein